jgi:hypothetical protein
MRKLFLSLSVLIHFSCEPEKPFQNLPQQRSLTYDEITKVKSFIELEVNNKEDECLKRFDEEGVLNLKNKGKNDSYIEKHRDSLKKIIEEEKQKSLSILNMHIMPLIKTSKFYPPIELKDIANHKYKNFIAIQLSGSRSSLLSSGKFEIN